MITNLSLSLSLSLNINIIITILSLILILILKSIMISNNKNKSNKSSSSSSKKKIAYYMMAPFHGLVSLRDLYVRSLGGCASRAQQGRVIASSVPRSQSHGFYKSRSGEEDVRDLIRAASQGSLGTLNRPTKDLTVVPRSQSVAVGVGIARIDEDAPSDFGGDVKVGGDSLYPRSRSVAVVEKRRVGGLMP